MVVPVGTCYEEAWRFLIKEEEGELIHGTVESLGRRIGHAWVELPTGYIWEPQTKSYFSIKGFDIAASPIEEHRYTIEEAAIMLSRVGKHGPWTKEEKEQFLKGGNPVEVPAVPEVEREAKIKYFRQQETKWRETAYKIAEEERGEAPFAEAIRKADEFGAKASELEAIKPPAVEVAKPPEVKAEEWKLRVTIADTAYGLAHGVTEKDLRKHLTRNPRAKYWFEPEDVDYILREAKREQFLKGGNPMGKVITKEEAIGMLERLSMTPGEAARSLVAGEAERREIMQTVQQRVKREQNKWAPMDPREGPPLPRIFAGLRWPWKK